MAREHLEVAIAAGGTAGHINPALALAEELRDRGHHVRFFGQTAKLEGRLVPEAGFELVPVVVSGFDRARPWTLVSSLSRMRRAQSQIARLFSEKGAPDVAIGFGAYVEMPLLNCCHKAGVPYLLHEQNSVPGLANKALAPHAEAVCISVPAAREVFERAKRPARTVVLTGNPVRRSVTSASREAGRAAFGVEPGETMLLVFGGSLGAAHINEASAASRASSSPARGSSWCTPPVRTASTRPSRPSRSRPRSSCAGASCPTSPTWARPLPPQTSCSLAPARPPSRRSRPSTCRACSCPTRTPRQTTRPPTRATSWTRARAVLLADDKIDEPVFAQELLGLVDDPARRERMRECARGLGQARAAAALADQVEAVCAG